jgi:ubiquinone/menaquinone biosynthesis C-methylase UbiE
MANGHEEYFLGYRRAEQERLKEQALQLADEARWLFDQIDLAPGSKVVEIGCGPRGCLEILSECVGPSGSVTGIERSEEAVDMARRMARDLDLKNVDVRCGDARSTELPRGSFDLATARLVLVNVPEPEQIVAEAVALVWPGGWVAFHEADWIAHICDPPSKAWTAIVRLLVSYTEKNGIDLFVGRKLPNLLRSAGLADIRVKPLIHVYQPGAVRRNILLDFAENLSERILAGELVEKPELDQLKKALRHDLDDPNTLVISHLFLQAWGRKPA